MTAFASSKDNPEILRTIKHAIEAEVFVAANEQYSADEHGNGLSWIMDFRKIILCGDILSGVSDLLLEKLHTANVTNFQVGGLETAAIPLVAGVVLRSAENGVCINGFFIRKSRKKTGLLQVIEGVVADTDIVIVDDLINSGNSVLRQIEILEDLGKKVTHVCVILQFKNSSEYVELTKRGIKLHALFMLDDFSVSLGLGDKKTQQIKKQAHIPLRTHWKFKSPGAALEYVIPKSAPTLHRGRIYFGSDGGIFWCLNSEDGSVVWQRKVLYGPGRKRIFSSPTIMDDVVFFGGYDGNFYALDVETGKPRWVSFEADWIGSSPCIAKDLGFVFVGVEYGFSLAMGGIIAYNATNGDVEWKRSLPMYTHGSPAYSKKYHMVVIGSNDGVVYGLSATSGKILWTHGTGGEIKAGCAFSPDEKHVAVGSFNKRYVFLETKTGKVVSTLETLEANYSTPVWLNNHVVICASLDKCLYAFDILLDKILWKFETSARIFASPIVCNGKVYIGNNAGILFVVDAFTGTNISSHQITERVTNAVVVDPEGAAMYIPTCANEIYKVDLPRVS